MSDWISLLQACLQDPALTDAERAALDRILAGARELEMSKLRLDIAAGETAGRIRDFVAAFVAGDAALSLAEAEEIAGHPDLAELNVMLDGFYAES